MISSKHNLHLILNFYNLCYEPFPKLFGDICQQVLMIVNRQLPLNFMVKWTKLAAFVTNEKQVFGLVKT